MGTSSEGGRHRFDPTQTGIQQIGDVVAAQPQRIVGMRREGQEPEIRTGKTLYRRDFRATEHSMSVGPAPAERVDTEKHRPGLGQGQQLAHHCYIQCVEGDFRI